MAHFAHGFSVSTKACRSGAMSDKPPVFLDAVGAAHGRAGAEARIASLVPSITELVCTLGLTGQLVARTGFCIHPRAALDAVPKVGGTKDVNLERLRALRPTHVIVNIDENDKPVADQIGTFVPNVIVTHPKAPEDNLDLYRLLGGIFKREAEAESLCAKLEAALARARARCGALPRERVLYLIWKDPWMSVARDTYISRTLAAVGWDTVPVEADRRYPEVDVAGLAPQVDRILLSTEPYSFAPRHVEEIASATGVRHVSLIDGEMTSWYGPRAIAGFDYLARLRLGLATPGDARP